MRELFGKQVGDDVAREALERGVTLGGEQRTVAALFVDVIGSTALAGRERPERVVDLLNGFFAAVVEVVGEHGGLVNKFEGDGAHVRLRRADRARRLRRVGAGRGARAGGAAGRRVAVLDAAIGVSCGTAVAGNMGAEERYEYTVIGDPVNEASRLCELAKHRPGRTLASATDGRAGRRARGVATGRSTARSGCAAAPSRRGSRSRRTWPEEQPRPTSAVTAA